MDEIELSIICGDVSLPATLTLPPSGPVRGGVVSLHPASEPSRDQFLFHHLAQLLPPHGVAVLRYDRRATPDGSDVPLEQQAQDALIALETLRSHPRIGDVPAGLWGFSQGAWAAPLAASLSPQVAFLIVLASTGVSPARQMRYGTEQQLLRAGYSGDALAELAGLRAAYEDYLRGHVDAASTQALVDRLADRPWFSLAWVPRTLPPPGVWEDRDFDPAAIFARVRCPVLLFYGEDDEWIPIDESVAAWRQAALLAGNTDIAVVRLHGTGHHPTLHDGRDIACISPLYTEQLLSWLEARLGPAD